MHGGFLLVSACNLNDYMYHSFGVGEQIDCTDEHLRALGEDYKHV